jgi:hypothetical protein
MKTNGEMNHGGQLKPECRDVWARYYCRYIREYEKEGVPFWGLTVQNEPEATQTWESCRYTAAEERDFVRDYLGPTLRKEGLGHLRLMIWDHNRDVLYDRARVVYDDPEAAQYSGRGLPLVRRRSVRHLNASTPLPGQQLLFSRAARKRSATPAIERGRAVRTLPHQRPEPLDGGLGNWNLLWTRRRP